MEICIPLNNRVRRLHLDATLTRRTERRATTEEDVASLAPIGTPRVLDLPEVLAALRAIANDKNTVVKVRAARRRHNTRRVELERRLICLYRNRNRLLGDRRHERRLGIGRDILIGRERRCNRLARRLALIRTRRRVRIRSLRRDALVLDNVLKGVVHETAVAALVALRRRAVDELLLREAHERAIGEKPRALHRARRGERPARTALLLILDRRDRTLGRPVDRCRER